MTSLFERTLATGLVLALSASPAHASVHDSLPDLLSDWIDIQEDEQPDWQRAWLRYEAAQSTALDPTLYAGRGVAEKEAAIDAALGEGDGGFPDHMRQLAEFEQQWAGDLAAVNEGMRKTFNRVPEVELYLVFSMAPGKLAYGLLGGRPSACVNARRLLPYSAQVTRLLLAKAMVAWVQPTGPAPASPPAFARRLHDSGLNDWAVGAVLPELSVESLLELTSEQAASLAAGRAGYAKELGAALYSVRPEPVAKYFGAGLPVGRYMALIVAREMAATVPASGLVALSAEEYTTRARVILGRLAGG